MTPVGRWIPLTTEVVEEAMVDLVFPKIRHIALILAQETINNKIWQTRFFKCLSQDGFFGTLIRFDSSRWNLNPRVWSNGVNEHKHMIAIGDVGKSLVFYLSRSIQWCAAFLVHSYLMTSLKSRPISLSNTMAVFRPGPPVTEPPG